jgi:O-acetyl-ADP-ribose deacetylase (regulator of RNase III)
VIHTVGPRYKGGLFSEAKVLAKAYRSSLTIAFNSSFSSIAFPSISTGVYGYPIEKAAKVALETTSEILQDHNQPMLVRFVLFSNADYEVYQETLQQIVEGRGEAWRSRLKTKLLGQSPAGQ